ncbi:hypothetical protein DSC45_17970 [Streptomyces sp. YIM 130001]|uniref:DUF1203 domain-containing protein n=1 Tax=Streptomyces sp. YIM 130001 TaxID=2259644 RepID=UPI000E65E65F|nr:DUF1203 domain-containing protein [Streptomyces sp. YIM 130001]RII15721.1 hypothetical protein DSC45_17970 [Streptomyces sp. YIM 130001]
MSTYRARPVPAAALDELRIRDDSGRPPRPFTATEDGVPIHSVGSPLRCCLRPVAPGERIALVSYAPLRRWAQERGADPGAYDEAGPVFVHAEHCEGPRGETEFPFARPGALRTVRRYDTAGHITGGSLLEIPEDAAAGFTKAFDEAFADPAVALVHVRALEYGCFHFEVRRP